MKVVVSGATGAIGSVIIQQLVRQKDITQVVALTRRPLPDQDSHKKLKTAIIEDFGNLQNMKEETWTEIQTADALVWAMGTYNLNEDVNLKYPIAFEEAFITRQLANPQQRAHAFKFILLSGAFVETDQSRRLFFLWDQRRMKGLLQTRTLELAKFHPDIWEAIVIRPGGILFGGETFRNKVAETLFGTGMVIKSEVLGAAVGDLIINGTQESIVENSELVERGGRVLQQMNDISLL